VYQTLGKVLMILMSLITTAILTRKLGAGVYGAFVLTTSVFLLLDSIADFGSRAIGVREAAQNPEKAEEIFSELTGLRLLLASGGFLIGLLIILFWPGFAGIKVEALISLSMIFFTSLAGSLEIVFQTKMKMGLKTIMDICFPLGFLILILIFRNFNLLLVMVFYLIARIFSLVIGEKLINRKIKLKVDRVWHWLKEMWPMGVYLLVFTAYDRAIDSMMIRHFWGLKEVAWYGLSYKMYINLLQPAYFFVASIFPLLSSKMENKRKLFMKSMLFIVTSILIAIPLLWTIAPWMISALAGSDFGPSIAVFRVLVLALFFAYLNHLFGFSLISKRGQKSILYLGLIVLAFNIFGNWYCIPRFGIMGAAWITVGTEALSCLLLGTKLLALR